MPTNVTIPNLGDSVSEAVLIKWHKQDGDYVGADEAVCELETDKANVDVPSPVAGIIKRTKESGETVHIGEAIATVSEGAAPAKPSPKRTPPAPAATGEKPVVVVKADDRAQQDLSPAVRRMVTEEKVDPAKVTPTGPGGRITKEDVAKHLENKSAPAVTPPPVAEKPVAETKAPAPKPVTTERGTRREPMTKLRKKIAERLVSAQHTAAILTTFNEVDLQAVNDLRAKYKEKFEKVHGIGLGYMSFFSRAACLALKDFPKVNASIDGDDVVYHDYVNLGIAVSTERGLTVPVLRNADQLSFAQIEQEIKRVATASRDGKLGPDEMSGGTFTITNGGVFGSLLSTPIINMPQAGILGMHTIQKRPVVVNDQIVIRPMMYIALSYDHRLVDGKESVSFLVKMKEYLEDPARMVLGL